MSSEVTVGFAIMSHADPAQLLRLVEGLNKAYDNPPIACHHDTHQTKLDPGIFPANVRFVARPRKTGWGVWSCVEAGLDAITLLYEDGGPDWFFLLSAGDYPIMPGSRVRQELAKADFDALLDFRPVLKRFEPAATVVGEPNPKLVHYNSTQNHFLQRRFYLSPQIFIPIIRRTPRLRLGRHTLRPLVESPLHPFRNGIGCFVGDLWIGGNRKAAASLITPSPLRDKLARHYRFRVLPDESFFQTMLLNDPGLRICRNNRRFAEWNGGGAHPMLLTEAQLPEAFASGAFFARKFQAGSPLLDRIDEQLSAA